MSRPFKSDAVLSEHISEPTLRAYHVGFDQNEFRLTPLVDVIRRVIPEFALGYYEGHSIALPDVVDKLQEAANLVYTTEKYRRRGEFGELILHLLLRDFCGTIPLVSKIYFKDSENATVHGFDGVHVTTSPHSKLWLGESKLYSDGIRAIKDLAADVHKHVNNDYLRREFRLIKRKLPHTFPEIEQWRALMDQHRRLDDIYDAIVIPMVATYSSRLFSNHVEASAEYFADFTNECRSLHRSFFYEIESTGTEIVLFLLPVKDKEELNASLDARLKAMQRI